MFVVVSLKQSKLSKVLSSAMDPVTWILVATKCSPTAPGYIRNRIPQVHISRKHQQDLVHHIIQ